jgi:uncharacterized protein (DUF736 family)
VPAALPVEAGWSRPPNEEDIFMATIGFVQKQDDGSFAGQLTTLALKARIRIVPVAKSSDNGPDYRVVTADGVDIGAGWTRTGRTSGQPYVSLKIDDPTLPQAIYANLGRAAGQDDDTAYALIWNR